MFRGKHALRAALISAVSVQALIGVAGNTALANSDETYGDIIVTAQRQAQSLQDVPIAVSAFSAELMTEKQINNATQLQLSLPNVTFTKTNGTGANFTIRGIGDLCNGITCDSATAIHMNDLPLFATRIFETEYFDLERVEMLRGPQGTLFGRNATAGVLNFVTAKPDPTALKAAGEASYGSFNELRFQGMLNVPITDRLAVRGAGFYMKRDGYTENLFDGDDHDDRDMFALRGSVRWEPTDNTVLDFMAYYFKEDDKRLRIQKQMCVRDPVGIMGCLPNRRAYEYTNGNATFSGTLASKENLTMIGGAAFGSVLGSIGLGSLYGIDRYANTPNPADPRKIWTDYTPKYFAEELQLQGKIEHDFGGIKAKISGQYQKNKVNSSQDYIQTVASGENYLPGLANLAALSETFPQFQQIYDAVYENGQFCSSMPDLDGTGLYGGHKFCSATPQDFDHARQNTKGYTGELILSSDWSGPFNVLVGGIYNRVETTDTDYAVSSFSQDYTVGVLGAVTSIGNPALGAVYLGSPFFWNNNEEFTLKSWGLFGEVYYEASDKLRFTAGLRYNDDQKYIRARSTLASFPVPFGTPNINDSPYAGSFDADPGRPGNQAWQERTVSFGELTGRFVIDYKITEDNLLYASYSRGYKSGGINPPMQPVFSVPETFAPEFINAFEIGSKNRFADGVIQLNATAFYYKYKGLQLSRVVARTSVNDNVDANIYGLELEGVLRPVPALALNLSFSWLKAEVADDLYLADPFDPSGGRSDVVIVKDISNASNCAVVPTTGTQADAIAYVTSVNSGIGLQAPIYFAEGSGFASSVMGAYGVCSALNAGAAAHGVEVLSPGVAQNVKGNKLPQAPEYKVSLGLQYDHEFDNGMSLVPRADMALTGESYGAVFNDGRTRIESYAVFNAQVQLNAPDDRWYLRAYVQNITNNNAVTGLYSTDQSSGNFTNIFTLEPRRYGITAGFRF